MFRGGGHGGGRGRMHDSESQRPGVHFHEAITLPLGNRTSGSIPNVARFICYFYIVLSTLQ